ncbi:MAG: alpha/beta fold hydrolase [Pseudomonadota bacterium]
MRFSFFQCLMRGASLAALAGVLSPAIAIAADEAVPKVLVRGPAHNVPVANFFQHEAFSKADLSPSGQHVGMLYSGKEGRVKLAVMEVASRKLAVVAALPDGDISDFHWVNDKRMVFSLGDRLSGVGEQRKGPGLYAINRDGSDLRLLVARRGAGGKNVMPSDVGYFATVGKRDTDDIYVLEPHYTNDESDAANLLRLNTMTGKFVTVQRPGKSTQWLLDAHGEPRVTVTTDANIETVFYKDPGTEKWRKLVEFDGWRGGGIHPEYLAPDGTFYVTARDGKDKVALYTYDLVNNKLNPTPVLALPDFDVQPSFFANSKGVLGILTEADRYRTTWFDDDMKRVQAAADVTFPNAVNIVRAAQRAETPFVLVNSFSDVNPGNFYLYNTETKEFLLFGKSMPSIDPAAMSSMTMVRYKARDGLEIPAYLTLPRGAAPKDLPLVVMVHGGPTVRGGHWGFSATTQFLASRGYAVLEPDFRGSTGYGIKHEQAGWRQWGLAMQNDVADGAKWAVAQGYVNPKRICIAGASYGGYATLMGLINDPDIFRCGIDWVGVTDISLLYSVNWSDMSDAAAKFQLPLWIGDRVKDAAQLEATSPIKQAARLKQPVILAYGGSDNRVPIVHGTKFRDAVKTTNPDVEWIEYVNEGHGWTQTDNNVDFWTRVEKFLDRNIGK